jgi:acyl carrier protein
MHADDIVARLAEFVVSNYPSRFTAESLPRDQSLLELGVLDSAGVIELIVFVESTWAIAVSDDDITKERMGSLNKLAALVRDYVAAKP